MTDEATSVEATSAASNATLDELQQRLAEIRERHAEASVERCDPDKMSKWIQPGYDYDLTIAICGCGWEMSSINDEDVQSAAHLHTHAPIYDGDELDDIKWLLELLDGARTEWGVMTQTEYGWLGFVASSRDDAAEKAGDNDGYSITSRLVTPWKETA